MCGNTVVPLADALDFPWYARISPAARSFLVAAGADVLFSKSAGLLGMAGGSHVSAVSIMRCVHRAGELCADEDAATARSLVDDGVVPDAECEASEICVESDGTYFKLQGPEGGSVEVKAMVAYAGKLAEGGKVLRARAVRHGCATRAPREFWEESTAAVGTRFDLSKVELAHMGSDGEAQDLSGFLRCGCDEAHSIDPLPRQPQGPLVLQAGGQGARRQHPWHRDRRRRGRGGRARLVCGLHVRPSALCCRHRFRHGRNRLVGCDLHQSNADELCVTSKSMLEHGVVSPGTTADASRRGSIF